MKMSSFRVELKKVIDDIYDIEIGKGLSEKLLTDIQNGLVGNISKFVVVTDSNVKELYAEHILSLLKDAGYQADIISFIHYALSKSDLIKSASSNVQ